MIIDLEIELKIIDQNKDSDQNININLLNEIHNVSSLLDLSKRNKY